MSQDPNPHGNVTGNMGKKIKGTVVLDFNNFASSVICNVTSEFLGQGVSLQLVSASKADPGNGLGKVGKAAYLENLLETQPSAAGKNEFGVHFDWDEEIGVPGAILVRNNRSSEFHLVTVALRDIPNHGDVHFVCNSWVYPAANYKSNRIFFANKTYLPHETPEPLRKYREQELISLRGDGVGERQGWERIYDYATYNDLGSQDILASLARPTLGGSTQYPYPRRGRTGRAPSRADPSKERRHLLGQLLPINSDFYVPRDENFGHLKQSEFLRYLTISQNLIPALESAFKFMPNEFDSFENVLELYEGGFQLPTDMLKNISALIPNEKFESTDGGQFLRFSMPQVIQNDKSAWMTDEEFAREMLAGVNPVLIRRLQEFPPKSKLDSSKYGDHTSKITKEQLEGNLDRLTVEEALRGERLFILDHHDAFILYLREINKGDCKAYATRTILFLKDDGTLRPVAIELSLPHPDGDQSGAVSKVYLPATEGAQGAMWLLAKSYVAVNDTCYHQVISHWLNTHAVVEPFVIATHRQLSALHPIHKLLLPHFRDTMNINALARRGLINAGGTIESSFLPGRYAMEMSSEVYKNWVFTDQALPADLIKRGMAVKVMDPSSPRGLRLIIKDYPFAIDGLEIWFAIETWVREYVSYYYKSDDIVEQDTELQAWWKELVEVGHGDKKDERRWPKMKNLKELIKSCTIIIWTSSALHAAVNFGQYPYGGYIPNRPTLSRRLMPEEGTTEYDEMVANPEKALLKTITPKLPTLIDLSVMEILSRHTKDEYYLGERDNDHWTSDSEPLDAFKRFREALAKIEKELEERNKNGNLKNRVGPVSMPYTLLYPSSGEGITGRGIPNSISI